MVMCPRCGRANEGKYRFCLGCGAVLAVPDGRSAPPAAPASPAPANPAPLRSAPPSAAPSAPPVPAAAKAGGVEAKAEAPRVVAPALPPRPAVVPAKVGAAPTQLPPATPAIPAPPAPAGAAATSDELPTAAVSSLLQQVAARMPPPPHAGHAPARPQPSQVTAPPPRIATGPNHNPVEAASLAKDLSANTLQNVPRPVASSEAKTVPPGTTLPGFQLAPGAPVPPQRPAGLTPGSQAPAARPPASRYAPPPPPGVATTPAAAPGIPPMTVVPAGAASSAGSALASVCATCGADIPPGNAFCGTCGTPAPQRAPATPPPAARQERIGYIALIDDNGTESLHFPLMRGENRIGSGEVCQLRFPDDGLLAPVHCAVDAEQGHASLRPIDHANGVFVRITVPVELHHGDVLRIGQEVLRFERLDRLVPEKNADGQPETVGSVPAKGVWGRLCQLGLARHVANAYLLSSPDVFLGRERGDILFPRDGFVSGSHAVISDRNGRGFLKDLASSNGTFIKAKGETSLRNGDLFLLGRNLLRLHLGAPT